jgi:hypothetical protein
MADMADALDCIRRARRRIPRTLHMRLSLQVREQQRSVLDDAASADIGLMPCAALDSKSGMQNAKACVRYSANTFPRTVESTQPIERVTP